MSQAIARSEHQKRVLLRRGWHKGVAHRRLDRTRWSYDPALASADYYVDSHLPRPSISILTPSPHLCATTAPTATNWRVPRPLPVSNSENII